MGDIHTARGHCLSPGPVLQAFRVLLLLHLIQKTLHEDTVVVLQRKVLRIILAPSSNIAESLVDSLHVIHLNCYIQSMRLEIVVKTYINMAVAIGVKETVEVAELLYLEWGKKTGEVSVVKPVICEPPVGDKVDFWTKRGTHPSTAATHTLSQPASRETWLRRVYRQSEGIPGTTGTEQGFSRVDVKKMVHYD